MKRYVIVGNGIAAAGCIEGIRKTDKNTPITETKMSGNTGFFGSNAGIV